MVLGSFLFGILIGSVPAAISAQTDASSRYCDREKNVKEYLQEHKVETGLTILFSKYRVEPGEPGEPKQRKEGGKNRACRRFFDSTLFRLSV